MPAGVTPSYTRANRRLFSMWKKIKKSVDGVKCGEVFQICRLPASTRHHSGEFTTERKEGGVTTFTHLPTHWQRKGWALMDAIPRGWEKINAATLEREKRERAKRKPMDLTLETLSQNSAKLNEVLAHLIAAIAPGKAGKTAEAHA